MIGRWRRSATGLADSFADDWRAAFGPRAPQPSDLSLRRFRAAGWTGEDTRRIAVLARQTSARPDVSGLSLANMTVRLLGLGLPRVEAYGWIEVLVGHPEKQIGALADLWSDDPILTEAPVLAWSRQVGSLGPLAWAAGLPLDEATEQHAAGGLDPSVLSGLAALRGFRLSDSSLSLDPGQESVGGGI